MGKHVPEWPRLGVSVKLCNKYFLLHSKLGPKVGSTRVQGFRFPELLPKINQIVGELLQMSREVEEDRYRGFFGDAVSCLRYTAGLLRARCDYLDKLPYRLARCRLRDVTQQCLDEFDGLSEADKTSAHRVTIEFCVVLRSDMEQWASGGELTDRLAQADLLRKPGRVRNSRPDGSGQSRFVISTSSKRRLQIMMSGMCPCSENRR